MKNIKVAMYFALNDFKVFKSINETDEDFDEVYGKKYFKLFKEQLATLESFSEIHEIEIREEKEEENEIKLFFIVKTNAGTLTLQSEWLSFRSCVSYFNAEKGYTKDLKYTLKLLVDNK